MLTNRHIMLFFPLVKLNIICKITKGILSKTDGT